MRVVVAEYEEVRTRVACEVLRETYYGRSGRIEDIFPSAGKTAVTGPVLSEAECQPGMETGEEGLQDAVVKDGAQQPVAERTRAETVAVAETEGAAANGGDVGLRENLYPQGFEVGICPHVVVALEEIQSDPGIPQVHKGGEYPHIALGHHVPVFIPEVPDVPEHIETFRFGGGNRTQEVHETGFPRGRVLVVQA